MKNKIEKIGKGLVIAWIAALCVWAVVPVQAQQTVIKYLRQLLDVKLGTLANGDLLTYSSTAAKWTNQPASSLSGLVASTNGFATQLTATNTLYFTSTNQVPTYGGQSPRLELFSSFSFV